MKYIDRKTKKIVEVKDQKILIFLYTTKLGRIILKITTKTIFSKIFGYITNYNGTLPSYICNTK